MKAFLSYSHQESEIVHSVADQLGRPFVTIDKHAFDTADELVNAMEAAVEASSLFVFFASKASMRSAWVNFELGEARYHAALNRIKKVVVVILDDRISVNDFPAWMRRYNFVRSKSPRPIARIVRSVIDELVQDEQGKFFVGRGQEASALQSALVPPDSSTPASLVAITGLPGIGRRTLLSRVARDSISIARVLKLEVEIGDSVQDLATKLADLVEPVISAADSIEIAKEIQGLDDEGALRRFLADAETSTRLHEIIVLYDAGGLLDANGGPSAPIRLILSQVQRQQDLFVALLTSRRPMWRFAPELNETPVVNVGPLPIGDVRQLVALQARARGLRLSADQIAKLAEQAREYPPAVNVIVRMAESYGPELAVKPSSRLSSYSPRPLLRYLRGLEHDSVERTILQVLSGNSPLPIQLVEQVVGVEGASVREALMCLIDTSLVVPDASTGWYRISEPIVEYVEREYSGCTKEQYQRVARALRDFLRYDEDEHSYFELERVRFRALLLSGQAKGEAEAASLAADWIRLAEQFYHRREYQKALEIAQASIAARPNAIEPITWAAKSQIKLGEYEGALLSIDKLAMRGQGRDSYFLRGFLERSRSRHRDAIRYYERALSEGYGGLAIHRDLAECYLHMGDIERASRHIEQAQSRQPDNRYVVDLRIKILCLEGKESEARDLLQLLAEIDEPAFAAHRRSRVEFAFGNLDAALVAAEQAARESERPPFEVLANLALCQIRNGRTDDAGTTLGRLSQLYGNLKKDVQTGLKARRCIALGEFEEALVHCRQFESSDNPVHLSLEREAIMGVLDYAPVSRATRGEYESRLETVTSLLQTRFGRVAWDVDPG